MPPIERLVTTEGEREYTEFEWGEIVWVDDGDLTDSDALTVGKVTIRGNEENPEHLHPNCDEALYLLSGELEHTVGDESVDLASGDLVHIPRGEPHKAINHAAEDAVALIVYDTGSREFEAVE